MSFESCFGGFASSKSAPAAMGGKGSFAPVPVNGGNAPIPAIPATASEARRSTHYGRSASV
jgi:hypothetical protein